MNNIRNVVAVFAIAGLMAMACGCKREAASALPEPFKSARTTPPPTRVAIREIPAGLAAERVHQLLGQPDVWGNVATGHTAGGYSLNTSYMTTGRMGPLPTTNHPYMMMGMPHHSLCWVYDLRASNEFAFLQFTNYRVAWVSFGHLDDIYDP